MSGVGDIIAIAELGYKLAEALKKYIDEVETAEESIKALAIEVEQASSHVGGLSKLLDENQETTFLSPVGEKNCERLAADFKTTILTIRIALGATSESEIDLDKIVGDFLIKKRQKWQWPLLSRKLLAPRERLGDLKLELQLLMVSATAHKLSKMPSSLDIEKQREDARAKLRRLKRTKERVTSRYRKRQDEQNVQAATPRPPSPESTSSSSISFLSDDDEEELILEYLEARKQAERKERREYESFLREKEQEERRRTEREKRLVALAEQMEREAESERRKEEVRREVVRENEIERMAEAERQRKKGEYETRIREAILGTGLQEERVNEVMSKIEESAASGAQLDPLMFLGTATAASQDQTAESTTSEAQTASTSRRSEPRKRLFRRWGSLTASVVSDPPAEDTQQPILEAWSLKSPRSRMPLPVPTLLDIVKKQNYKSVLKSLASLSQAAKDEFHALMEYKDTESQQFIWQLVGIQITRHRVRVGLLTYAEEGVSVVAVLQRQDDCPPEEPTRPKLPQSSASNHAWPSSAAHPVPPSILKKHSDPSSANKPSETGLTPEHRVRISSEAPDNESQAPSLTSLVPRPSTSRSSAYALSPDARIYNDAHYKPDLFDGEQSIYSRHRSRSRDSRAQSRRSRSPQFVDTASTRPDRSSYGSLPIRSSSRDSHTQDLPASRNYLRSRSRSRPRSDQHDPSMPSIDERLASGCGGWDDLDFDSTGSNEYVFYAPPRRPFPRRSSTDDSDGRRHRYTVERSTAQTSPLGRRAAFYDDDGDVIGATNSHRRLSRDDFTVTRETPLPIRRRSPPPPQRSDSWSYGGIDPHRRFPSIRSPPRRRRSDSYDIQHPSPRVFVGGWPGAAADSRSPPSRRATMSPDRANNGMALVLREQMIGGDFERLRKKAKKHAAAARRRRRSSTRRNRSEEEEDLEEAGDQESGDGSETEERYERRKGKKATVADLEDGEESESELPGRFQEFFNPDYKPPVVVNGTSEKQVENPDRNERIDSSVLSITEEALNGLFTSEPQSMDGIEGQT